MGSSFTNNIDENDNSYARKSSSKYEIIMPEIPEEPFNMKYSMSSNSSKK